MISFVSPTVFLFFPNPQILIGLRDTDDEIVYLTMHALAELVPVLGAATVVGGAQAKIFSQGKPKVCSMTTSD